mgnify:CR=1 FL=1
MPESLADRIAQASKLAGELSVALEKLLPDEDGPKAIRMTTLIQKCPDSLAEIPEWFAKLSPKQLENCWVQAIVHAMTTEEEIPVREMCLALLAVRDHPNIPIFAVDESGKRAKMTPQPGDAAIIAKIEAADEGNGVILADVFESKTHRTQAVAAVRRSPDWLLTKESSNPGRGRPRYLAMSKAAGS